MPHPSPFPLSRRRLLQGLAGAAFFAPAQSLASQSSAMSSAIRAPAEMPLLDPFIEGLISRMTLEEKAGQLSLYADMSRHGGASVNPADLARHGAVEEEITEGRVTGYFNGIGAAEGQALQRLAVEKSRLGIPLIFGADIEHGMDTIFPIGVAEACGFDPDLCRRTARAAGVEATARGLHWTFAPMVDVARDERWGRVSEGAGEDPFLGAAIAAARIEGFHGPDLHRDDAMLACVKHFAAYGAVEGGMDYNTAEISEATLRQVHLPAFKAAIDAGCLTVMSSFNDIAGVPASGNRHLLTDILRGEWGFKGFVVSDYRSEFELVAHGFARDGADAAKRAILAGCDVSMQSGIYMKYLPDLVRNGAVPEKVLNEAVRRVLRVKKAFGLFEAPYKALDPAREARDLKRPETVALAREAAQKSCVLLKNERDLLPLGRQMKIALVGPFATDRVNMNGAWVVFGNGSAVTLEQAFREKLAAPDHLVVAPGSMLEADLSGGIAAAVAAAADADVVVVAVGETEGMSGEAQSRSEISLPAPQQRLVEALAATGRPMVVVLAHGRALALGGAVRQAGAILAGWFLGSEGAHAIADLIFGDVAPSGRLAVSFPQVSGQEPYYYNHRPTGRPDLGDDPHFRARYREVGNAALYPFGHGLTYGRAAYGATRASSPVLDWDGDIIVTAEISNTGARDMREVAQLYVHPLVASLVQPVRALRGFKAVDIAAGAAEIVWFKLTRADLAIVTADLATEAEPGEFDLWIAPSAVGGTATRITLAARA